MSQPRSFTAGGSNAGRRRQHPTRKATQLALRRRAARDKNIVLALVPLVAIVAKIMVAFVLPPKYFYDNNRILGMSIDSATVDEWEGTYRVAADLFKSLNVFGFQTMLDWSFTLGVIFTILVFLMVIRVDSPDFLQSIFILAATGLLNIYVFNIGKDIIQFAFFFAVYIILILPIDSSILKIGLSCAVLYYESTFFREYYVLIAALVLFVFVLLSMFRLSKGDFNAPTVAAICVICFLGIYAMMVVAQAIMPSEYQQMIGLRAGYLTAFDGSADSQTLIKNWIPGDGLPIFMANYLVNAIRMLLPVELMLKGMYYLPFFVFQLLITFYMVHLLRRINKVHDKSQFLALCVFIGYALASFIFEPDFGSWVRHESATFPVLHLLILSNNQRLKFFAPKDDVLEGAVS
ncbi:hypothetical protein CS006_02585 [Bifidobacterium primatium]|uniref:Uncharacterized protein n=1 Tax=Bifidobacterium primatium TaxID=2045438 RepID=A0A2M9HB88_9BIFI|nr:hypothetical protein [Bifidobacterium primatium]PJM74051.1 hypothetical protein CS006_02585 [Bifidobacterium primatium]